MYPMKLVITTAVAVALGVYQMAGYAENAIDASQLLGKWNCQTTQNWGDTSSIMQSSEGSNTHGTFDKSEDTVTPSRWGSDGMIKYIVKTPLTEMQIQMGHYSNETTYSVKGDIIESVLQKANFEASPTSNDPGMLKINEFISKYADEKNQSYKKNIQSKQVCRYKILQLDKTNLHYACISEQLKPEFRASTVCTRKE